MNKYSDLLELRVKLLLKLFFIILDFGHVLKYSNGNNLWTIFPEISIQNVEFIKYSKFANLSTQPWGTAPIPQSWAEWNPGSSPVWGKLFSVLSFVLSIGSRVFEVGRKHTP